MAGNTKLNLKITMLKDDKERIRGMAKDYGFSTMSGFVIACVDAFPLQQHVDVSQKIMHTFDRLHDYESDASFKALPRKERQTLALELKNTLITLCSDAGKL